MYKKKKKKESEGEIRIINGPKKREKSESVNIEMV